MKQNRQMTRPIIGESDRRGICPECRTTAVDLVRQKSCACFRRIPKRSLFSVSNNIAIRQRAFQL